MTLCACGCGQPAPVAQKNHTARGYVKGQPMRFVAGHQMRGRTGRPQSNVKREKLATQKLGSRNPAWKDGRATYRSLHKWVRKHANKIGSCARCGAERYTEWANISGEYHRDLSDYVELCKPCHNRFDRGLITLSKVAA